MQNFGFSPTAEERNLSQSEMENKLKVLIDDRSSIVKFISFQVLLETVGNTDAVFDKIVATADSFDRSLLITSALRFDLTHNKKTGVVSRFISTAINNKDCRLLVDLAAALSSLRTFHEPLIPGADHDRCILLFDESVGSIMKALDELKIDDNDQNRIAIRSLVR